MRVRPRAPSSALVLGAGIILGLAGALLYRKAASRPSYPKAMVPDWFSDYRKQPDGIVEPDDLADGAAEDSFPASDPPSFNGNRSR